MNNKTIENAKTEAIENEKNNSQLSTFNYQLKVPKLRFKEFSGEWEEKKLGDVAYMKAGKFIKASNIYASQKNNLYPCYGGNGLRGYTKVHTHEGVYSLIGRQGALLW
ncbi:restriction endonuclease subunit S domain-containing protein [Francisella hispaniensis]|uniref:hypothetical protein n=1 Tax=Francisella hispaniensis TaxID=622488 RepID=UPI001906E4C1|nr:hypothetical protein [Francisella hispaniensis]MBK2356582.1 hypothetical protein [Francisella hispaniensis]